jgi:DNA-binding phage protein
VFLTNSIEVEDTSIEIYRLQQKLIKLEQEKEAWNIKLQGYIEREEQMRELINQLQISRNNSFKTVSTHSSAYLTEEEEEEDPEDQEIIYSYYTDYYPKSYPYYYNDYYYNSRHQQYYYYD